MCKLMAKITEIFTKTPITLFHIVRYLIRLGGDDSFSLSINNSPFKTVPVYSEPVFFTGDDNVKSIKTCQDFNIMTGGLAGLEELFITCHDFKENGEFEYEIIDNEMNINAKNLDGVRVP